MLDFAAIVGSIFGSVDKLLSTKMIQQNLAIKKVIAGWKTLKLKLCFALDVAYVIVKMLDSAANAA